MPCRSVHLSGSTKSAGEPKETTRALEAITLAVAKSKKATFLVGAGISTSAGIPDFRSKGGLYEHNNSSAPTLKGPALFSASVYSSAATRTQHWSFLADLHASTSRLLDSSAPVTPTHGLMHTLHKRKQLKRVYSQNIDGFEATAGLRTVGIEGIEVTEVMAGGGAKVDVKGKGKAKQWEGELVQLHGSLQRVRCSGCEWVGEWTEEHTEAFALGETVDCPACEERAASRARLSKRAIPSRTFVRPSIVLYEEKAPAASSIGSISISDLSSSPDLLIVAGTSLRIPGFKKLVKEFSKAVRSKGGIAVFVNREEMTSQEWKNVFDYQVIGNSDDFSTRVIKDWKSSRPRDWVKQKTLEQSLGFSTSKKAVVAAGSKKPSSPSTFRLPLRNVVNLPKPKPVGPFSAPSCPRKRSATTTSESPSPNKRSAPERTPTLITVPLPALSPATPQRTTRTASGGPRSPSKGFPSMEKVAPFYVDVPRSPRKSRAA